MDKDQAIIDEDVYFEDAKSFNSINSSIKLK